MDTLAEYGRQILSLVVVFSLLGVTVWKLGQHRGNLSLARLAKAFFGKAALGKTFLEKSFAPKLRSGERVLESVERLALTPQHTLHLLRLRDREILVATHPQGCTLLDRAPDTLDQNTEREPSPGLASRAAGA